VQLSSVHAQGDAINQHLKVLRSDVRSSFSDASNRLQRLSTQTSRQLADQTARSDVLAQRSAATDTTLGRYESEVVLLRQHMHLIQRRLQMGMLLVGAALLCAARGAHVARW
jgi:hypothetical protein